MTRGEFERLVERYRLGECTPEEIAFVANWMEMNADNQQDDSMVFKNDIEAIEIEDECWDGIQRTGGLGIMKSGLKIGLIRWVSAVACLVLIIGGVLLLNHPTQTSLEPEIAGLETSNMSTNRQRVTLPDSSIVILEKGASIVISEGYGIQTRRVRLKGAAFFEIKPNSHVPFLVYSGDLITEVLGTSFTIKPEAKGKTIEVSVVTGKVSVYSGEKDQNQRRRGVVITTNQKAVYDSVSKTIREDLVDEPKSVEMDTSQDVFNFDQVRVKTVLSTLRYAYKMEIVVSNPELNECLFTGNLNGFDLFQQLNYVCDVIDAQYEVRGTTIFLAGPGCMKSSE